MKNRGRVKRFWPDRGYGFIRPNNSGTDVWFHKSSVLRKETVKDGDLVEFELKIARPRKGKTQEKNDGPQAINVNRLEEVDGADADDSVITNTVRTSTSAWTDVYNHQPVKGILWPESLPKDVQEKLKSHAKKYGASGSTDYTDLCTRQGIIEHILRYPNHAHGCPACDPILPAGPIVDRWFQVEADLRRRGDPPSCPLARGERVKVLTPTEWDEVRVRRLVGMPEGITSDPFVPDETSRPLRVARGD